MDSCPNCGKNIEPNSTVCPCGEALRGDITNVRGWETETVFRAADRANNTRVALVLVVLVVAATVIAIAWPRLIGRSAKQQTQAVTEAPTAAAPIDSVRSDLVPADDLIPPAEDPESGENVFVFGNAGTAPPTATRNVPVTTRNQSFHPTQTSAATTGTNAYDAQLVTETADAKSEKSSGEKNGAACKPEATAALQKQPETALPVIKEQPKPATGGYILGPRGGCFIVTPGGGKKYVDRALCSPAIAAAARQ